MNVTEILGVDAVRFVEPEFAAQTDSLFNDVLAAAGGDEGRLLVDGDGEPIALAFHGPGGWLAASFLFRNPTVGLIEQFESMNGEIFEEDRPVFSAAVREYYSNLLMKEVPPAIEDLNPVRRGILTRLIEKHWGRGYHGTMHRLLLRFGCRVRSCSGTSGMSRSPTTMTRRSSPAGLQPGACSRQRPCASMPWSRPGISSPSPGASGS